MPKFQVEIEEILQRVEDVEAESLEEALDIVEEKYDNQDIVLNYEDFKEYEIREYSSTVKIDQIKKDTIIPINFGQAIILEGNKDLALLKQIGKDIEPYIIVTNLQPHKKYGTYFEWDSGSHFDLISEASKEYEKRANLYNNYYSNDFNFSKLGKKTLENNLISKFEDVDEIFEFLVDQETNKEELVGMLSGEMKDEIISRYMDSVRKEGNEYFYATDMWCIEEEIHEKLIEIEKVLEKLNLEEISPFDVIELLEQKDVSNIEKELADSILKSIKESGFEKSIEEFIAFINEEIEKEDTEEIEENEM